MGLKTSVRSKGFATGFARVNWWWVSYRGVAVFVWSVVVGSLRRGGCEWSVVWCGRGCWCGLWLAGVYESVDIGENVGLKFLGQPCLCGLVCGEVSLEESFP
eukprot:6475314-Amphidinium_carterae.2